MIDNNVSLQDAKQIELQILKYFADVCSKLNVKYYLAYGTLIGAVRHKGFIPWDDDIDVWMSREDYEVFINYFIKNENNMDRYQLFTPRKSDYYLCYAKLIDTYTEIKEPNVLDMQGYGLFVDIFPLDNIPTNTVVKTIYFRLISVFDKMRAYAVEVDYKGDISFPKVWIRKVLKLISKSFGHKIWMSAIETIRMVFQPKRSSLCNCIYMHKNKTFKKTAFANPIYAEFEGEVFSIPEGYDEILTAFYGDYMTLPPEKDRVSHNYEFIRIKQIK